MLLRCVVDVHTQALRRVAADGAGEAEGGRMTIRKQLDLAKKALREIPRLQWGKDGYWKHADGCYFEAVQLAQKTLRQLRAARPSTPTDSGKAQEKGN